MKRLYLTIDQVDSTVFYKNLSQDIKTIVYKLHHIPNEFKFVVIETLDEFIFAEYTKKSNISYSEWSHKLKIYKGLSI